MKKQDEAIVAEAKKRFERCEKWESNARKRFRDDIKFCNGDAYNRYQWPTEVLNLREGDEQPCLTINKTRQHCLQIINDARQNKSSVKITPTGDGASYEAAQIYEGVVRHIEYISDAQTAYSTATWYQVEGGIGYIRVATDYADDNSFDQEIFIRRITDPMTVYMDPDAKEYDRSDARFGFVYDDMPRDQFEQEYPQYKDRIPQDQFSAGNSWVGEDHVRVAEYFRRKQKADKLVSMQTPEGPKLIRASKLQKEELDLLADDPSTKFREVVDHEVEWFMIVGSEIVERGTWPGNTIPIVPVIGEETVIDGEMDRKGHTRALIDPQRMYNYWTSEATAQAALQSKTPYIAPMGSTDDLETYYETANRVNHAILPYNAFDDQGRPLPAPVKQQPPIMAPAYLQGMQTAANEMALVSGQYQADFGAPSNERSGKAINERQRQGDNATYHFVDHFAMSIRGVGKILIDLIPKVYDTPRVIQIMAEDGRVQSEVHIDPQSPQALQKVQRGQEVEQIIFNPNIGRYDVQADIGPSFGTRRQEAFNALMQLAGQSEELMKIGGDLVLRTADFPLAEELAERWQRTIPPTILGNAPPPDVQQMQAQNQSLQAMIGQLMQQLHSKQVEDYKKADDTTIDAYRAETDRLKIMGAMMDPQMIQALAAQLALQISKTQVPPQSETDALATHIESMGQQPAAQPDQGQPPQMGQSMPGMPPMPPAGDAAPQM